MEQHTLRVTGMKCISCEQLIENEIGDVDDVARSNADYETGTVEFTAADSETGSYIEHTIRDLGYEVTEAVVERSGDT